MEGTEDEIDQIKQMLTQSKSLEEKDVMNKKLKETEERLWKLKVKISHRTKQWIGREESPC